MKALVENGQRKVVQRFVSAVTAGISSFLRVEVDGTVVDAKNYMVTEGSTIVTFTAEYLESLATGKHTVAIVSSISGEEKNCTIIARWIRFSGIARP